MQEITFKAICNLERALHAGKEDWITQPAWDASRVKAIEHFHRPLTAGGCPDSHDLHIWRRSTKTFPDSRRVLWISVFQKHDGWSPQLHHWNIEGFPVYSQRLWDTRPGYQPGLACTGNGGVRQRAICTDYLQLRKLRWRAAWVFEGINDHLTWHLLLSTAQNCDSWTGPATQLHLPIWRRHVPLECKSRWEPWRMSWHKKRERC